MSRLYLQFNSDTRETSITSTGRETIEGVILWGDRWNSKRACYVAVTWPKEDEQPTVFVTNYLETENPQTTHLKQTIRDTLTNYHNGQEDTTMTLHRIGTQVDHHMPESWSFNDFKEGREKNNIPLTA